MNSVPLRQNPLRDFMIEIFDDQDEVSSQKICEEKFYRKDYKHSTNKPNFHGGNQTTSTVKLQV